MEIKKVGIKFEKQPKMHYYNSNELELQLNDNVVVESPRGLELARVVSETLVEDVSSENEMPLVVRIATAKDLERYSANKLKAEECKKKTSELVKELNLDMKLINSEIMLDGNKIIITFTSEKRVDFRELVKKMAQEFKMKIELRQVGPREEVKLMGSIGICGRKCCCNHRNTDLEPVNIKMAKTQNLSLNPNNISGVCGRLLCCLAYENDNYIESHNKMPVVGSEVGTPDGKGQVVSNNLLQEVVRVRLDDGIKDYHVSELKNIKKPQPIKNTVENLKKEEVSKSNKKDAVN